MRKKILLIDLDAEKRRRIFPNLALMKLSAYHKREGDEPNIIYDYKESIQFRGARGNLRKFLRLAGRLA